MFAWGDALIRFYHHKEPDELTDEEWAIRVNEIQFVLQLQKEIMWGKGDEK